ncbi:hypothetical protein ABB37_00335 [Leptomonas pyrrhocoris]|uniref:Uncharacterized protein n=1 Tax=Leptomonas pyrrhocoris TaxID=157538 RepID=A0A0M9GAA8_LEPPY|nr:hypothetical protein ABB37_00335 [Leptomonas pyrrhocoris]KPA86067.1 hypothetical protein ABB37_00335 [Leptomonas pyrrhocoris]|eukprot:XP_015664506.1 hypothetical protein ABB37_00335 [Leptomonas pyrrhocoris]
MASRSSRESLKRRREGYQLSLHQYAELKRHRTSCTEESHPTEELQATNANFAQQHDDDRQTLRDAPSLVVLATDQGSAALASRTSNTFMHTKNNGFPVGTANTVPPALQTSGEVDPYRHHAARTSHELSLQLRPIRIEVVRGDSGRRCSFYLQSSFLYSWHRGNHFYHSLDGEQMGLELHETVLCLVSAVLARQPHDHAFPFPVSSPLWPLQNPTTGALMCYSDRLDSPGGDDYQKRAHLHNEEAASPPNTPLLFSPRYAYEAAQVSRRRSPPTSPGAPSSDIVSHLGSCSPALFVDCLLKCVHDEAALPDDHGWVYLYHGRHIATDVGRTRLLHDLFALGYFPHNASENGVQSALSVCVFHRY